MNGLKKYMRWKIFFWLVMVLALFTIEVSAFGDFGQSCSQSMLFGQYSARIFSEIKLE